MRRILGLLSLSGAAVVAILALVGFLGLPGGSSSAAAAVTPAQQIGMKVLLITDSSANTTASGIAYQDWVNTLKREGVPFDSVVTNGSSPGSVPLPTLSSTASDGTQVANYEGVVVATSGSGGIEHRPVDDASDLRAAVLGAPDHRLRGAERRLRDAAPSAGRSS